MTIEDLKTRGLILFECISGSRAYDLAVSGSDTDIRGVFLLPKADFYGLNYIPQVANSTNDIVYYELGRFIELLKKSNPSMLELLATPADKILIQHDCIKLLKMEYFLSKKCKDTFGGYAFTQIKKARGLNKKIVNPVHKVKKQLVDFCYVLHQQGALPLATWLSLQQKTQAQVGLVNIDHFKNVYGLYYDETQSLGYRGIWQKENATTVLLSSIPVGASPLTHLYFNEDGFTKYCKDYKAYWRWVAQRNEQRYQANTAHGKNYDAKNMMHTFRLLAMAEEILQQGKVLVKRPDRENLLSIRRGEWSYEDLLAAAAKKMQAVTLAHQKSTLPDQPDANFIDQLLIKLRTMLYEAIS